MDNSKGVHEDAKGSVMSQSTSFNLNPVQAHQNLKGMVDLMAASMEMPATMEILRSNDVWVCDTAVSNHFSKSQEGDRRPLLCDKLLNRPAT